MPFLSLSEDTTDPVAGRMAGSALRHGGAAEISRVPPWDQEFSAAAGGGLAPRSSQISSITQCATPSPKYALQDLENCFLNNFFSHTSYRISSHCTFSRWHGRDLRCSVSHSNTADTSEEPITAHTIPFSPAIKANTKKAQL